MTIRDMTFTDARSLEARAGDVEYVLEMDEDAFRAFYDRTASAPLLDRPLACHGRPAPPPTISSRSPTTGCSERGRRTRATPIGGTRSFTSRRTWPATRDDDASCAPLWNLRWPLMPARSPIPEAPDTGAEARADLSRAMAQLSPRERALVLAGLCARLVASRNRRDDRRQDRQAGGSCSFGLGASSQSGWTAKRTRGVPMKAFECPCEPDLVDAIQASRWPERVDPALSAHVAECPVCRDVATVAPAVIDAADSPAADIHLPEAGAVWASGAMAGSSRGRAHGDSSDHRRASRGDWRGGGRVWRALRGDVGMVSNRPVRRRPGVRPSRLVATDERVARCRDRSGGGARRHRWCRRRGPPRSGCRLLRDARVTSV